MVEIVQSKNKAELNVLLMENRKADILRRHTLKTNLYSRNERLFFAEAIFLCCEAIVINIFFR